MKLISFDIGIKNMAYCIFTVSLENKTLSVQDWNILNLMDLENTIIKKTCSCQLIGKPVKKKDKSLSNLVVKICGKSAKFEKGDQTFCEMHAKKHASENTQNIDYRYIIPNKEISPPSLKKMSKEELIHLGTIKYPIFTESQIGTVKTKKGCLDILLPYFQEHCFVPILAKKTKGAGEVDLITIGRNMRDRLNELSQNSFIGDNCHVIMENQISPLAGRMKTIQGMLTQYYIMQELSLNNELNNVSQNGSNNKSIHIEYISSANKLKDLVVVQDKSCENSVSMQEKYKQHKSDSIQICSRFLAENPEITSWTSNFSNSGKKDDLADCFLQGIWYLKREKIISYAENLKINIV